MSYWNEHSYHLNHGHSVFEKKYIRAIHDLGKSVKECYLYPRHICCLEKYIWVEPWVFLFLGHIFKHILRSLIGPILEDGEDRGIKYRLF